MKALVNLLVSIPMVLIGCSAPQTHFTAYHTMPPKGDGRTFWIVPINKNHADNLECQDFGFRIAEQLEQCGYPMVSRTNNPNFLVWFDYGIDSGRPYIKSIPQFGQIGGGLSTYSGTVYSGGRLSSYVGSQYSTPQYGVVGSHIKSGTTFIKFLEIGILDVAESSPGNLKILYQVRVTEQGPSDQLGSSVPNMIRTIFKDFPGKSGVVH